MSGQTKVVVVGQGYVGLPVAIRTARQGYSVAGYELDQVRAGRIAEGDSFTMDVPGVELREELAAGRYRVSTDPGICRDFDIAIITVPTPLREGVPDVSFIRAAGATLAGYLRRGATVVLESSTYPGTTDEVLRPALEERSGLVADLDFALGYSPERIDPGPAHREFWRVPKLVAGVGPNSLREVEKFYSSIVDQVVPVSGPKVAELAKLLENTFRHINIALVNEIAMFAGDLGIDVWEAIDAAATKPFGFMKFVPGPGVGGHCLPVDPSFLSWRVMRRLGVNFRFVDLANDINAHMPDYVVRRVVFALNADERAIRGSRILLLGLAYKANTGDARESAALAVAELLVHYGADVHACDPLVETHLLDGVGLDRTELTEAEVRAADLVVILTDHDQFDYDLVATQARRVLDTRHRVEGQQVEHL